MDCQVSKAFEELFLVEMEAAVKMPDDAGRMVVSALEEFIYKISDYGDVLREVLNYLAVSISDLRTTDLKSIIEARNLFFPEEEVSVLLFNLQLCLEGDDEFAYCYVYEMVYPYILKHIPDVMMYKEHIKDHIKTLDSGDILFRSCGMHYARITRDVELARALIREAYDSTIIFIKDSIKDEIFEDEGDFVCDVILQEKEDNSPVIAFFLETDLYKYMRDETGKHIRRRIKEALVKASESICDEYKSMTSMKAYITSCIMMGEELGLDEWEHDDLWYFEKALVCAKEAYARYGDDVSLEQLGLSYFYVYDSLMFHHGRGREAQLYYEKMLDCGVYRENGRIENKQKLKAEYHRLSKIMELRGLTEDARRCLDKMQALE